MALIDGHELRYRVWRWHWVYHEGNAYVGFPAHSARTGSNSGTRGKGRFDPFATPSANGCYLREADLGEAKLLVCLGSKQVQRIEL